MVSRVCVQFSVSSGRSGGMRMLSMSLSDFGERVIVPIGELLLKFVDGCNHW